VVNSRSGSSDSCVAFELSDSSLSTLNAGNTGNGGIEGDGGIVRREIDGKETLLPPDEQSKPSVSAAAENWTVTALER
jgi:hypothetical protein